MQPWRGHSHSVTLTLFASLYDFLYCIVDFVTMMHLLSWMHFHAIKFLREIDPLLSSITKYNRIFDLFLWDVYFLA